MQPTSSQSHNPCHNVFVYGTLKRGQDNHHWLDNSTYLGRRRLIGGQLHDRGPYPMALLTGGSDAVIHGELFRVSDAGLHRLDQLEGYPGFYDRSALRLSDGTTAWVYHGTSEQVAPYPVIAIGDWDTTPVLHYGSNLDPERLKVRCPDWDGDGVVVQLDGWSWAIDKQAWRKPQHGYAGIQPCNGAITWGVVAHHTAADLEELDEAEGATCGHYRREWVLVQSLCGASFDALTYVPCDSWRQSGLTAEPWYQRYILSGLDHWKLPAAWRTAVAESLSTTTNGGIRCQL